VRQRHTPKAATPVLWGLVLTLLSASEASAYVDPGSGALLWQVTVAAFVGGLLWLRRVPKWLKRLRKGRTN